VSLGSENLLSTVKAVFFEKEGLHLQRTKKVTKEGGIHPRLKRDWNPRTHGS
jgi:hypothetical protein